MLEIRNLMETCSTGLRKVFGSMIQVVKFLHFMTAESESNGGFMSVKLDGVGG